MDPNDQLKDRPPVDPVTGQPAPRPEVHEERAARSTWPLLVILLAGLVLALIAWLPAELTRDAEDTPTSSTTTTTEPATDQPATSGEATPPAATPGGTTPAETQPQPTTPAPAPAPEGTAPEGTAPQPQTQTPPAQ
ncbi:MULTISPECIES: hypothetical protein [Sinorhizobium]|uniref:hypothetical protein n=1 Tax=Sinorhizobium TaxID=28105 RepID=UPI000BEA7DFB|nr:MULTISPECIES: hypothetical protein [Sinorhizobium]PDT40851.1 hypothetical protein CO656_15920 [Sinorhizobium sp. FG01]PDT52639.1 hypothetical protein CO664_14750 [Sinorhizobium sp. NG07B]